MKIETEAEGCSADDLQPDRIVIDEDMMQYIDENESKTDSLKTIPDRLRYL